ncbi:hypothetical protein NL676_027858 [Syzygium grande]|nr:hypothetical protein NL676_027858 [Syzygium grande]
METPPSPSYVIVAYDATKVRNEHEFGVTLNSVLTRGDILRGGDTIVVLGVLHKVPHPMGYQLATTAELLSVRAMEEEVCKKIETFENMLLQSAEKCEDQGVSLEVKITAGNPLKQVILQEAITCKATWVILDRHLRRDLKFYQKQIPCKVGMIQDSLSVDVLRAETVTETNPIEHKSFYYITKPVLSVASQVGEITEQSDISNGTESLTNDAIKGSAMLRSNMTTSDLETCFLRRPIKEENNIISICQGIQKKTASRGRFSEAPILCARCGTRTKLYIKDTMPFSFNEIQLATKDFSKDNLVGEGGYGYVYKGRLKDGQEIAAKVRKEASAQGFMEFNSEIHVLSFARHKNIVMLLGYSCKENLNVLVYEYICNKSLDWHLFDNPTSVLEWHQRYAIAIGTAKRYLAPEYAENGTVSIRTDVYAFGMVLLQLITGRKVVDPQRDEQHQSLRQWAEPLLDKMELHELIDDRTGESYDTYELYLMAKATHLCLKRNPDPATRIFLERDVSCTQHLTPHVEAPRPPAAPPPPRAGGAWSAGSSRGESSAAEQSDALWVTVGGCDRQIDEAPPSPADYAIMMLQR